MSLRACRLRPSRYAIGSARAAMRTPSSAMPSHSGWYSGERYDSTLCVSASMPVAAVIAGGRSSVSSGSANTHFASSAGEKMIFFMCVASSDTTAERPTSEPVPAVVGKAMKYGSARSIGRTCGWSHAYSRMSPGWRRHQRDRLGDVERRAAAQADHRVGAVRLVGGDAFVDLASDRVAPDAGEDADVEADSDATKSASSGSGAMPRSVTMSGRLTPSALRWSATSARAPGPKWMMVGKLNREMVMGVARKRIMWFLSQ